MRTHRRLILILFLLPIISILFSYSSFCSVELPKTVILSNGKATNYVLVDPDTGEELVQTHFNPATRGRNDLTLGYMGKRVYLISDRAEQPGKGEIFGCDSMTGENVEWVTDSVSHSGIFMLDGSDAEPRLVFSAYTGTTPPQPIDIHAVNENGSGHVRLTRPDERLVLPKEGFAILTGSADNPCWSPDGKVIAYTVRGGKEDSPGMAFEAVVLMDRDGGNKRVIYSRQGTAHYRDLCWTADGNFVILGDSENSTYMVRAVSVSTMRVSDLTPALSVNGDVENFDASPIDMRLAFNYRVPGGGDLYVASLAVNGDAVSVKGSPTKLADAVAMGHGYANPDWGLAGEKELEIVMGDVNNDGVVKSSDAILVLRIITGLLEPSEDQKLAADVNGDGQVKSDDAILILRKAAGLAAPGRNIPSASNGQITTALGNSCAVNGKRVKVPIEVDRADILAGGDICITHDSSALRMINVSSSPDVMMAGNTTKPGVVYIAFASTGRLSSKTLAEVEFDVIGNDIASLKINTAELYGHDSLPLNCRYIDSILPSKSSALLQNFPNPFNPETWIPYKLEEDSDVTIRIYGVSGKIVQELKLGYRDAGFYTTREKAAHWDGRNEAGEQAASGIYFYAITAGDFSSTGKMIITK